MHEVKRTTRYMVKGFVGDRQVMVNVQQLNTKALAEKTIERHKQDSMNHPDLFPHCDRYVIYKREKIVSYGDWEEA